MDAGPQGRTYTAEIQEGIPSGATFGKWTFTAGLFDGHRRTLRQSGVVSSRGINLTYNAHTADLPGFPALSMDYSP
jgi:hypothetical protein